MDISTRRQFKYQISNLFILVMLMMSYVVITSCQQTARDDILSGNFGTIEKKAVTILSPDGNSKHSTYENLNILWTSRTGVLKYTFQLASDSDFNKLVIDKETTDTNYTIRSSDLTAGQSLSTGKFFIRVIFTVDDVKYTSESRALYFYGNNEYYVNAAYTGSEQFGTKDEPFTSINDAMSLADFMKDSDAEAAAMSSTEALISHQSLVLIMMVLLEQQV